LWHPQCCCHPVVQQGFLSNISNTIKVIQQEFVSTPYFWNILLLGLSMVLNISISLLCCFSIHFLVIRYHKLHCLLEAFSTPYDFITKGKKLTRTWFLGTFMSFGSSNLSVTPTLCKSWALSTTHSFQPTIQTKTTLLTAWPTFLSFIKLIRRCCRSI
jgi:hypothetical protein